MAIIPSTKSTVCYKLGVFDVVVASTVPGLALVVRDPNSLSAIPPSTIIIYIIASVCFSIGFFVCFRVACSLPIYFSVQDTLQIGKATLCVVTTTAVAVFTFTNAEHFPRSVPIIHFFLLAGLLAAGRIVQCRVIQGSAVTRLTYEKERHVIIVGTGTLASLYIRYLDSISDCERRVAAVLDDDASLHGRSILGYIIVGGAEEVSALLDDFAQHGLFISSIVVCEGDPDRALGYRDRLGPICRSQGLQLELLIESPGFYGSVRGACGCYSPTVLPNAEYFRLKRAFETVIAGFCLILFLPIFASTAILVLVSMGSPIIFWQRRVGQYRRPIFVYKFRTLRNPVDKNTRRLTGDERNTRIGSFLRATRLDELPQLVNIVKGDMAIVGPRPLLPSDQPADPSLRLAVAPGLTGWAQINGGKLIGTEEKNALDEWYVRNACLRLDAEIAWRTFLTILWGDRRNDDQLGAALARARKEQNQGSPVQQPL
jgi:lipopolysaccharide/colanic/teichoic acid biosynthesis glycosyltransferase